ncbi:hypothetical protein BLNAU_15615 [Blattamonas nauphoetae]|uniref:Uncharacterized protein n=1 Tax=Blattamonas nauphoetae TaxID=2049346 RepID=A0ABQ9XGW2_9EUKA|nr:hypothetical protein BLNAU_15615 [Blattamonas nauphoetae]
MSTYGEPQELEQGDDAPRTPTEILAQISEEMVPQFLELRAWPENVKKEFLDNLYKSMVCIMLIL